MSKQSAKRIPAFDPSRAREFFTYVAPINDFLAGSTRNAQVEIQGDSDFELVKISSANLISIASPALFSAVLFGEMPISMINQSNSESFFSSVDYSSFSSSGKWPYIFSNPIAIESRSIIDITITNNFVDLSIFTICLIGAKVYG